MGGTGEQLASRVNLPATAQLAIQFNAIRAQQAQQTKAFVSEIEADESTKDCKPADVMLVVDSSASISKSDWKRFVAFSDKLIAALPIGKDAMHVGMVEYNTKARLVTKLEGSKAKLTNEINAGLSKFTSGRTHTHKAVRLATDKLIKNGRSDKHKLIILLTDGLPSDRSLADAAFSEAHAAGIDVQIVTIGRLVSYIPIPARWSTAGFVPIKLVEGYSELLKRIGLITSTICKLTKVCTTNKPKIKYIGHLTNDTAHPYVYATRASAAAACVTAGYRGLCSKEQGEGFERCNAGWYSDFKGYWMSKARSGCGSGRGWQGWGAGKVGAFCCGPRSTKSGCNPTARPTIAPTPTPTATPTVALTTEPGTCISTPLCECT